MAIPAKVLRHLQKNKTPHQVVRHKKVYTAFDLARTLDEKFEKIAKTLLVRADKRYVVVTIPAHYRLDLGKLKKVLKAKAVEIAKEPMIKKVLNFRPGAIVPFGKLHKLETVFDAGLRKAKEVVVGAGSFTESLRMKVKDLEKLEDATVADIGKSIEKDLMKAVEKGKKVIKKAMKRATSKRK
ncbi:MAG: YbaK/EbsC family protein [Patescibacteria group bacterium]